MMRFRRRALLKSSVLAGATNLAPSLFGRTQETPEELKKIGSATKTRFAVNVEMWWTNLPFLDRIRRTAELGFPAIEFWPLKGKDLPAIAALTKELGVEVAQFTAWGFKPGMNDPANHDAFEAAIVEACSAAKQLRCKLATVVAGDDIPGMSQEEMHANVITALKRVAPIAEQHDLTLILEPMNIRVNHKGHCLYGSGPTMRIVQEVASTHVKINWDLYHMQITEGDLCGHLKEGLESKTIGYLQLADHPGRHEPGTGEVHYNRVLKEAYDLGYRGYVGLECTPLKDEVTAARRVAAADIW
ncbi:Hydroxypyruvate isomerase [Caulifigura coniformis]|uniref:Hydroxypyruvate isomerase n=1 Tax=Caulifigura coniformis TaxID=2527983 RepID=A0A517SMQ9_9PLAN|nr:TIM barrel protein [Caulifigura coniformis]QDT57414.1 Hydroxypyruvate isomerase [Caulifigura coniformis]